jgi:hypothetical protein
MEKPLFGQNVLDNNPCPDNLSFIGSVLCFHEPLNACCEDIGTI